MREPVCTVQSFVSIYGRHLTKLFPTTRFLSEMPAEEAIFGQLLLVDKRKVPYLHKTTSKEFEFLHKIYATAIAMATMTFQDVEYFGFKVI
jgi:hypothetical protein